MTRRWKVQVAAMPPTVVLSEPLSSFVSDDPVDAESSAEACLLWAGQHRIPGDRGVMTIEPTVQKQDGGEWRQEIGVILFCGYGAWVLVGSEVDADGHHAIIKEPVPHADPQPTTVDAPDSPPAAPGVTVSPAGHSGQPGTEGKHARA